MCVAKINDSFGFKYKCNLEDYSIITSVIIGKDNITRKRIKTLCKKHANVYKKNMRYEIKHLNRNITFTEVILQNN